MTEREVQDQVRKALRSLGYTVLSTSSGASGRPRKFHNNQDKGVPDLLVSKEGWGVWIGLEVKSEKGALQPEQRDLADKGMVFVVRSLDDALRVLGWAPLSLEGVLGG